MAELDREVTHYIQSRPYVPCIQPYPDPDFPTESDWVAFGVVARHVRPLPKAVYLIAGDAVHNIRTALDYLAWQLVLKGGQTPGKRTEFPILWDKPKDRDSDGVPILMNPHPTGLAARLLDAKWLQPYHAREPKGHPLFVLYDLDRIDKHRHLNIITSATGEGRTVLHLPDGQSIERPYKGIYIQRNGRMYPHAFEDGAPLGLFSRGEVGAAQYGEVHVDSEVTVQVTLGELRPYDDPTMPVVSQLRILHDFVRDKVVSLFLPLF
ncbi:MAG TPA: hypothetical protein VF085_02360 [Solirubrobacterales bacterium]